jgi:hypothetical protein
VPFPALQVPPFADVAAYREYVRGVLRGDAPAVVLGIVVLATGVAALGFYASRRRPRSMPLLWLACFAVLYGVRLVLAADSIPFILGISPPVRWYINAAVSC